MKKYAWLWLVGACLFLVVIGGFVQPIGKAFAGDDPVTQLSMSVDAGADIACSGSSLTLGKFAVQSTVAAYVATTNTNDGGVGVLDSTKNIKIPADWVYDVWTTNDKRFICCKPAANGPPSTCKILKYREF